MAFFFNKTLTNSIRVDTRLCFGDQADDSHPNRYTDSTPNHGPVDGQIILILQTFKMATKHTSPTEENSCQKCVQSMVELN